MIILKILYKKILLKKFNVQNSRTGGQICQDGISILCKEPSPKILNRSMGPISIWKAQLWGRGCDRRSLYGVWLWQSKSKSDFDKSERRGDLSWVSSTFQTRFVLSSCPSTMVNFPNHLQFLFSNFKHFLKT